MSPVAARIIESARCLVQGRCADRNRLTIASSQRSKGSPIRSAPDLDASTSAIIGIGYAESAEERPALRLPIFDKVIALYLRVAMIKDLHMIECRNLIDIVSLNGECTAEIG